MIQVTCIQKYRDKNNNIIGYKLIDKEGITREVTPLELKDAMISRVIDIDNLKLTSDNKLINSNENYVASQYLSAEEKLILKLKVLGYKEYEVKTESNPIYFYIMGNNTIMYIPDDVTKVFDIDKYNNDLYSTYIGVMIETTGIMKVVGGRNLEDMSKLLIGCNAKHIDFRLFHTEKAKIMSEMFTNCNTPSIDLSNFNTSNVINMSGMFWKSKIKELNLSSFDTRKVTHMDEMFYGCNIKNLDISNFKTPSIKTMTAMFYDFKSDYLDIQNVTINESYTDLNWMFSRSSIKEIRVKDESIIDKLNKTTDNTIKPIIIR